MGKAILAGPHSNGGGLGSGWFLLAIIAFFGFMYLVMIRPQRRRQREAMAQQSTLGPGQRVRTTAGMYGTIASVDGDDVMLEIAPGVEVRLMRRAIMSVISDSDEDGAETEGSEADASDGDETPGEDVSKDESTAANGSGGQAAGKTAS